MHEIIAFVFLISPFLTFICMAQPYPDAQGRYPDAKGNYPDARGNYPDAKGNYPDANGHYPDSNGRYPDSNGNYPDSNGQYPPNSNQNEMTTSSSTSSTSSSGSSTASSSAAAESTTTQSPASGSTTMAQSGSTVSSSNNASTTAASGSSTTSGSSNCKDNIASYLDKPISGGQFTFYGTGGKGACGVDTGSPEKSAAISGQFFDTSCPWTSDAANVNTDPACKGICVTIEYNGKTITVPANNKCPECESKHVDLSEKAFLALEPAGGTVGIAKNATITYSKGNC